jgi:hypothetical protein
MLALLIAAALQSSPACDISRLEQCRSTNELVLGPRFQAVLRAFLGDARGSYLFDNAPVVDQIGDVLGGPPDPPKRLATGEWVFSACREHDCPEKGAVVLSPSNQIIAIGLLSYDCHKTPPGQPGCELSPELTIFVQHQIGMARQPFYAALVDWAKQAVDNDRQASLGTIGPFQGVETRGILDERSAQNSPRR